MSGKEGEGGARWVGRAGKWGWGEGQGTQKGSRVGRGDHTLSVRGRVQCSIIDLAEMILARFLKLSLTDGVRMYLSDMFCVCPPMGSQYPST